MKKWRPNAKNDLYKMILISVGSLGFAELGLAAEKASLKRKQDKVVAAEVPTQENSYNWKPVRFIGIKEEKGESQGEVGFHFDDRFYAKIKTFSGRKEAWVLLRGVRVKNDQSLILGTHPAEIGENGVFESWVMVPDLDKNSKFTEESIPIGIQVVDGKGQVTSATLKVDWGNLRRHLNGPEAASQLKWNQFSLGVGLTSFLHQQSRIEPFSELITTVKAAYQRVLVPTSWDLGANLFWNAVPISTSVTGVVGRSLGANVRVGYALRFVREPFRLAIMVGAYYFTIYSTNQLFGVAHMAGPQVFPVLRWNLGFVPVSVSTYLKYSPIGSGFGLLSLSNRELAFGLSASYGLPHRRAVGVSLDFSRIDLIFPATTIANQTLSFGVNYIF